VSAITLDRPWLASYGDVPPMLSYPEISIDEAVMRSVREYPDAMAFDFLGATATYRELGEAIERCADALSRLGLGAGDRLTISMPTSPQGVVAFYAASRLGAVSSLIHPLSTSTEIAQYLDISGSRIALTLDLFYARFAEAEPEVPLEALVLTSVADVLPLHKRLGYRLTKGRKVPKVPSDPRVRWWTDLMGEGHPGRGEAQVDTASVGTILYSGGTTGSPKGIMLSHRNVVCSGEQVATWVGLTPRDTILAALPIFHGFGLVALVHAGFARGARVVMLPIFNPAEVAKVMRTKRPTMMAGVPTLYDALGRDPSLQGADLSCLRAAFCGADTLTPPVRERFERLVSDGGGVVSLLEGYGLTEAVTAVLATPMHISRAGSIGIPFPDTLAKICDIGTTTGLDPGRDGELCIAGPTVMLGYYGNQAATNDVLRRHDDGRLWLHTGDLAKMDDDGWFYFLGRLKRMIKSSGFNVYPAEVEFVLAEHPGVAAACVIGIPDEAQGERVKAFVVPRASHRDQPGLEDELIAHCRASLIKWSCPREVELRDELPVTRVGKVDFMALLQEEVAERTDEFSDRD
jgi:long-chain acyl-CoA synthetase